MSTKIAYLTSGAAGMYCGSCMHDNTLARSLSRLGVDIQLIPTYTPIRTDETDVAVDRIFFGGINVFLQQKVPLFRYIPRFLDRFLDSPRMLRWATSKGMEVSAKELGALTVSMLKGKHGYQRKEVTRLCQWLKNEMKPDIVVLSNMLIAGCVPEIKSQIGCPVVTTLQGDDIFLLDLIEPYQSQSLDEIRTLVQHVDGFLVNSRYYADFMSQLLEIPLEKIGIVPLGIETADFRNSKTESEGSEAGERTPALGYLARLAKEKGLHEVVDAFVLLKQRDSVPGLQLKVAGWLGDHNRSYAEEQFEKIKAAGFGDDFEYCGSVTRSEKVDFLRSIDVLSVPTTYEEPKGLFVLESIAAGVPVVQPAHGAFPELIERTQGGWLTEPGNTEALATSISSAFDNKEERLETSRRGREIVHNECDAGTMASRTLKYYESFLGPGDDSRSE